MDKLDKNVDLNAAYRYVGLDDGFFAFMWIPDPNVPTPAMIVKGDNAIPVVRLTLAGA